MTEPKFKFGEWVSFEDELVYRGIVVKQFGSSAVDPLYKVYLPSGKGRILNESKLTKLSEQKTAEPKFKFGDWVHVREPDGTTVGLGIVAKHHATRSDGAIVYKVCMSDGSTRPCRESSLVKDFVLSQVSHNAYKARIAELEEELIHERSIVETRRAEAERLYRELGALKQNYFNVAKTLGAVGPDGAAWGHDRVMEAARAVVEQGAKNMDLEAECSRLKQELDVKTQTAKNWAKKAEEATATAASLTKERDFLHGRLLQLLKALDLQYQPWEVVLSEIERRWTAADGKQKPGLGRTRDEVQASTFFNCVEHSESTFRGNLRKLINCANRERRSGTSDVILAAYLLKCLEAFESAVREREDWYAAGLKDDVGG